MSLHRIAVTWIFLAIVTLVPAARGDLVTFGVAYGLYTGPGSTNRDIYFDANSGSLGVLGFSPYLVGTNTPLNPGAQYTAGYTSFSETSVPTSDGSGGFTYGAGGTGTIYGYSSTVASLNVTGGTVQETNVSQGIAFYHADITMSVMLSSTAAAYFGMNPATVYYGTSDFYFEGPPQNGTYILQYGQTTFSNLTPSSIPEPASLVMLGLGLASAATYFRRRRSRALATATP